MASYIWQVLMHDAGFPAMITPRSARVVLSSWAKAARAAPGFQQLFVGVNTTLDVRLIRPKEGLHRLGRQILGVLVIVIAEGVDIVAPEVGDERADRLGLGEFLAVDLDQ